MYSRSFYPETEEKPAIPENYDGTALLEAPALPIEDEMAEASAPQEETQEASSFGGGLLSTLGRIPILSGLFGGKGGFVKLPKIEGEEILILATAALLFFSKEGDKECALILLFLLFIN